MISDDCSPDGTFAEIEAAVRDYRGPYRIVLNRNARNEGVSGYLSKLANMSRGELLVVAVGDDDVSVPERCGRLVECWNARGRCVDLIASDLVEFDRSDPEAGRIAPTDLGRYTGVGDAMRALLVLKLALLMRTKGVKLDYRLRMFLYAACPFVYWPFFVALALVRRRVELRVKTCLACLWLHLYGRPPFAGYCE